MTNSNRPSLLKQLIGAIAGGTIALALYYGYEFTAPKITAWLTVPVPQEEKGEQPRQADAGAVRVASDDESEEKYKRLASRTKRIAQDLSEPAAHYAGVGGSQQVLEEPTLEIIWPTDEHPQPTSTTATEFDVETGLPRETEEAQVEEEMNEAEVAEAEEVGTAETGKEEENPWEGFDWGVERTQSGEEVIQANADDLAGTGPGLALVFAGATGGSWIMRKRRKKNVDFS